MLNQIPIVCLVVGLILSAGCGTKEGYALKKLITTREIDAQLFQAAAGGNAKEAQDLLRAGANVNATEYEGETPLMYAAAQGRAEMVELLIQQGANIHARSVNDQTALGRAAQFGHAGTVEKLLQNGARVEEHMDQGATPLIVAADVSTAQVLISHQAQVNAQNDFGLTALMNAAAEGKVDVVKLLIESGADPALKDHSGKTARQWAAERNHPEVVALLKAPSRNSN